jgi:hypothetical protein
LGQLRILLYLFLLIININIYGQFKNIQINEALDSRGIDLESESPLYTELNNYFEQRYADIARRQLERIDWDGNQNIWGGVNHIGLAYNKDFASFSVELRRQVAPDLFHDSRYIVTDTFDIFIDASVIFKKLIDVGSISMDPADVAAAAGLTFKRSYRYSHFANNYKEAVSFNLDKLFFSFLNFRSQNFLKLSPGEFISKEDSLGVHAGGRGFLPLGSGLAAHIGALAKYEKIAKVEVHSPLPKERTNGENDYLRFNYERSKSVSLGISAGIVGDFLGLLQLTLLRYDLSYSSEESYKNYLTFSKDNTENELVYDHVLKEEIGRLLKNKKVNLEILAPYLVTEERRRSEIINSKFSILYWGAMRDQKTSHIEVAKDGKVKSFFRHNVTFKKYKKNVMDWLSGGLFKAFFKTETYIRSDDEETKSLRIEYDSEKNIITSKDDLTLDDETTKKLSIHFIRDVRKIVKERNNKRETYQATQMIDQYGGADPLIVRNYNNLGLKGLVTSHVYTTFDEEGIKHFNELSYNELKVIIERTCSSRSIFNVCGWRLRKVVRQYIKERSSKRVSVAAVNMCDNYVEKNAQHKSRYKKRRIHKSCLEYVVRKNMTNELTEIPLWRLRDVLQSILLNSKSKVTYYDFFGVKNVHIHGSIEATEKTNSNKLANFFKEGYFQGIGLISNYRRKH